MLPLTLRLLKIRQLQQPQQKNVKSWQQILIRNFFKLTYNNNRQRALNTTTAITTKIKNINNTMDSNNKTIIAIAQMRSTNNKHNNMNIIKECIERANQQNATMLFLPECCDFVGENRAETLALSETLDGNTMQEYCKLARDNCLWLSLGGIHELKFKKILDQQKHDSDNKINNSHVLINNMGDIVSVYRKLHLFDVDTPDYRFRESDVVNGGSSVVSPIATPAGRLGLQICYDVRFAEPSLLLRKAGAQLLCYPSAFAYSTGKAHWEILLRARAIETQCFVVAAAQIGWHNKKRQSWGHALIINPWGDILVDCGANEELAVAVAEIDLSKVQHTRSIMPCFEHRRNDAYALTGYNMGSTIANEDHYFGENVIDYRTIFYETEHSFAFTNLRCVLTGHVLVSTKRLTPRLDGLTCQESADLFTTVSRIQRMLEAYYKTTAATVTVQDGELAGQTVPHVHFHIMPRRVGDFSENDQIYVKLDDQKRERRERTLEERIQEAECYRKALQAEEL